MLDGRYEQLRHAALHARASAFPLGLRVLTGRGVTAWCRVLAHLARAAPDTTAATLASGVSPLTARERDVLVAARPGTTVSEIARKLFLSQGDRIRRRPLMIAADTGRAAVIPVRNYLSAAIAKTGVRNRAQAVRTADERGWL